MSSRESAYTKEVSRKQIRNRMIRQLAAKQIKLCIAGEKHFQQYSIDAEKEIERAGGETLVMISEGRSLYAAREVCSWCGCDIPKLSKKSARARSTKMCPVCSQIHNNFSTLKTRTLQALVQKLEGQSVVKETTEEKARFIMRDAAERRSRGEDAWIWAFRSGNRWFVGDLRKTLQWVLKHLSKRVFKGMAGEKFVEYLMYYDNMRAKGRSTPKGTNEWIDLMCSGKMNLKGYNIPKEADKWIALYTYLPDDF